MAENKEHMEDPTIRLCFCSGPLEEEVRRDGGHRLDRSLAKPLGQYVEWVPVRPAVESGLPMP